MRIRLISPSDLERDLHGADGRFEEKNGRGTGGGGGRKYPDGVARPNSSADCISSRQIGDVNSSSVGLARVGVGEGGGGGRANDGDNGGSPCGCCGSNPAGGGCAGCCRTKPHFAILGARLLDKGPSIPDFDTVSSKLVAETALVLLESSAVALLRASAIGPDTVSSTST